MDAVASLAPLSGSPAALMRALDDWLSRDDPPPLAVRTSGSSGEPKVVALSARAVRASAAAAVSRLGGPGQWVLALPASYVAGMQVVVRSLLAGAPPVVLDEAGDLAAAVEALSAGRRYVSLVPTQLHRMLATPADSRALRAFDAVLLGGSAARPALLDQAARSGVRVVTTYGMSETCGGCVYDGLPLDPVQVRVDRDDRVLLAGPVLFDGYVGRPDLTRDVLVDGWLRTPDLGRVDGDGRLEVFGRADDVAVSGGVNVPLAAVERRLLEHPSVQSAAVVALPDDEWGQRVVAVVVPVDGGGPDLAELREFVAERHPRAWAPRDLVVVGALPMLSSGKVARRDLVASLVGAARA